MRWPQMEQTNQPINTDTKQVKNDVINPKRVSSKTNNASCLNTRTIQSNNNSHFPISKSTNAEILYKPLNENIVGIKTRRNPTKETFKNPIKRRYRAPNKNPKGSNLVIPKYLVIPVPKQIIIQIKAKDSTL